MILKYNVHVYASSYGKKQNHLLVRVGRWKA